MTAFGPTAGEDRRTNRVPGLLFDCMIVLATTVFIRFVAGVEDFTFIHTPDSEFYLSLGAYTHEVTDRSPADNYYWTRFGVILPIHAMSEIVGAWTALLVWRFLLTMLIVIAAYGLARTRMSRVGASTAALFVATNSVLLGHVGDPYSAGAVVSVLSLFILLAFRWVQGAGSLIVALGVGLAAGWLAMINPVGLMIAGTAFIGLALSELPRLRARGLLSTELAALAGAAGFALVFSSLLLAGRSEFPGKDWLADIKGFVLTTRLSDWTEPGWGWLLTETSLLVPVAAAVITWASWRHAPMPRALVSSARGLASLPVVALVVYKLVTSSNVLETSVYNSMLWPSALLALVMVAAEFSTPVDRAIQSVAALVVTTAAWMASGHWNHTIDPGVLVGIVFAGLAVAYRAVRPGPGPEPRTLILVLGCLGLAFQLAQNGRPFRETATHPRVAYAAAYRANDTAALMLRNLAAERWVLSATSPTDQIEPWADRHSISVAAMQLWGPNGITFDPASDGQLTDVSGTVLMSAASSSETSAAMRRHAEQDLGAETEGCRAFGAHQVPDSTVFVCLHRLTPPG